MFAATLWLALLACDEGFDEPVLGKPATMAVDWFEWAETVGEAETRTTLLLWKVDIFGEPYCAGRLHDPGCYPFHDGRQWRYQHAQDSWDETGYVRRVLHVTAPDLYWSTSPRDRLMDLLEAEPRVALRVQVW